MNKDFSRRLFHSRLARKEEKRNLRSALLFGFLTISLLLALVFFGIPALVNMAGFVSDIKSTNKPVEQTDIVPPSSPQINVLPEYTKETSIPLSGFAEPGSTVEIFLNNSPLGTTVTASDGSFTFSRINLSQDKNELYAVSVDETGNKSRLSSVIIVTFDNTAPKLDISEPQDGQKFFTDRKRKIKISGQTEAGVTLTVNERLAIVDQNGNFSVDFSLSDGDNTLKIIATDLAGNQTEKDINVNLTP